MMHLDKYRSVRYASVLLSLVVLFCTSLARGTAVAAPAPVVAPVLECACCDSVTVTSACMPVCESPQHSAGKKPDVVPDSPSPALLDTRIESFRPESLFLSLHPAGVRLTGPPLFLRLHRLLN